MSSKYLVSLQLKKRRLFKYVVTVVEKNTSFISSRIFEIILIVKEVTFFIFSIHSKKKS
jgi:hypothetical protein